MRTFKTRWFARFARREDFTDEALREAIERAELGLIDADLGGGLIKQRIARPGGGRSGGYRMIVAFRVKDRAVFVFGFAKSKLANIDPEDLKSAREIADELLKLSQKQLDAAVHAGRILEIHDDKAKT